ncbi:30S ribosomal protein S3 [bacterium]|nr:30S ribosomal protein S3 [bacterium]OIO83651.1 MAG: 30S ribosomal protein S3 [Anaerolineae bacterium CG2_30_58_95]PIU91351.1 MAG: 30S ribosomal protein S3 [Anaerolineae bacterium CG06_land_8_20_14_3_00_57_67]PIW20753.1 MAG: 30S ribosomal protein S3 [Anaerolineae bacterium CG17_big_fil_post_rev_8_21_14_2_50_57_27]PIX47826.1 MAG: 30S ribosomal protein S3 [Anaerolineae bacterium CG_4_8_14_3_um_filter_59_70]
MGRKVHPIGFRLSVTQDWQGRWFAEGAQYREYLRQDFAIRDLIRRAAGRAGVSRIDVERYPGKVKVTVHTAKPGILIGRKGESVKKIRADLETLAGKKIDLDIKEIKSADIDAYLVAHNIADQLERRISYRRAMKRAIQQAMRQGAEGIKIKVAGRLSGAEMARSVWLHDGRLPLQTLRADIDFARAAATTTYGQIGVKVWVYKGEMKPEGEEKVDTTEGVYVSA